MDFGKVLSRAWQIIWQNKVLWIFGILAACGSRSGSFGSGFNYQGNSRDVQNLPPAFRDLFFQIQQWYGRTPPDKIILYGLIFLAILLLIVLIFWLIGIYGRTSLIYGALQTESGKKVTFRSVWHGGFSFFGRSVGLNTILSLVPIAVAVLVAAIVALVAIGTMGIGVLCLLPLICILVPVFLLYALYVEMANVALVAEDLAAIDSINRGWELFRNNLGSLIIMGLILLVGSILVNVIIAIPIIVVSIPFALSILNASDQELMRNLIIGLICAVAATPVLLLFSGILQSYVHSAWTLTYLQLTGVKKQPVRASSAKRSPSPRKK